MLCEFIYVYSFCFNQQVHLVDHAQDSIVRLAASELAGEFGGVVVYQAVDLVA